MKSNELRIGNLYQESGTLYKCKAIDIVNLFKSELADESSYMSGVPLTEEWLLKAGFKHIQDDWYYNSIMSINISKKIINIDNFCVSNIEFVHQLQNLYFALTGEELTFNI